MIRLQDIKYSGEAYTRQDRFYYRRAEAKDAEKIADMYAQCAIHRGNCKERLQRGNKDAFDKKGGMYLILDREGVEREIKNPHSFWALFTDQAGEPVGSFWFSDDNPDIPRSLKQPDTVYPREILVKRECAGKKIGTMLYYTVFQAMLKAGYLRSVCEVYRTTAYETEGIRYSVDLLNKPSYIDMLMMGGKFEGCGAEKEIRLPGMRVWVEPHIFSFQHERALRLKEEASGGRFILQEEI